MTGRTLSPAFLLLVLFGCGSLPVTTAVWTSHPEDVPETAWTRDPDTGLEWLVGNDDQAFYLRVGIKDRMRQMLVRRAGLTVFLSPSGSKDEEMFIQYPFVPEPATFTSHEQASMPTPALSSDLLWVRDGDRTILNPHLERTEFKAELSHDISSKMIFSLRIPLDSLTSAADLGNLHSIAIGIKFFQPEEQGSGMDMGMGSDSREGRPGGAASGRSGGGRGRPGDGGRSEARPDTRRLAGPVWFLAELSLSN